MVKSQTQSAVTTLQKIEQKRPMSPERWSQKPKMSKIQPNRKRIPKRNQPRSISHLRSSNYFNWTDHRTTRRTTRRTRQHRLRTSRLTTSTRRLSTTSPRYGTTSTTNSSRRLQLWSWFHSVFRRTRWWSDWRTWRTTSTVSLPRPTSLTSMLGLESST